MAPWGAPANGPPTREPFPRLAASRSGTDGVLGFVGVMLGIGLGGGLGLCTGVCAGGVAALMMGLGWSRYTRELEVSVDSERIAFRRGSRSLLDFHRERAVSAWESIELASSEVRQLFCRREPDSATLDLCAITSRRPSVVVLAASLPEEEALFFEQFIEERLGLQDVPVAGDFRLGVVEGASTSPG